jgi:hypothetical protein
MVPNDLDDTAHARLDAVVLDAAEEPSTLPRAIFLLTTIVATSEGRLNPEYIGPTPTKALLERRPELMNKLSDAWSAGEFREIRNLSVYLLGFGVLYP